MIGPGEYTPDDLAVANLKAHLFMGVVALESLFLDIEPPYDEDCVRRLQAGALEIARLMGGPIEKPIESNVRKEKQNGYWGRW